MTRQRCDIGGERGYALIYMTFILTALLLFSGLAVDGGRAYIVRAQLSKAVDGAALGAARSLNSGDPKGAARRIFKANFPDGYLGTTWVTDPATDPDFFKLETIQATGVNVVTVAAKATLPTTFMSLANFKDVTVSSSGEATRRMVDLSLVLDVSSSIGVSGWIAVRDAARTFVEAFDAKSDRFALVTYGSGAKVIDQMPSSRGFDKSKVISDIPSTLPGGSTAMAEGLYRGWDELRTVPAGQQSGLRVIVLFTDGASNSVPGLYDIAPGSAKGLRTADFPKNLPDPDNQTHDKPAISGLFDTETGNIVSPHNYTNSNAPSDWWAKTILPQVPELPTGSFHGHRRSAGIPASFPLQSSTLTVRGVPQSTKRGLRDMKANKRFPADVWNINNASRNLLEIIANAARSDNGDYRIRIYTIGMGELVRYNLGTMPEKPEEILMRVANDVRSPDFNKDQLEGKYYYAKTAADVGPAFQALQNQIVRLTK
jgi:Flp pilus assembly protein TadG